MVIEIPRDRVDQRLQGGKLWSRGWGDPQNWEAPTCLHGALRVCMPHPGDAYIAEQVGGRFGWGVADSDRASSWADLFGRVPPEVTDDQLAETFGPQWAEIVALVRRAAALTSGEAAAAAAAWNASRAASRNAAWAAVRNAARAAARAAAWNAPWEAAWNAAWEAAWNASRAASRNAAWNAAWEAAWNAAWAAALAAAWEAAAAVSMDAAAAVSMRDLIGSHGLTQAHYDALAGPWASAIGPVHPGDVR